MVTCHGRGQPRSDRPHLDMLTRGPGRKLTYSVGRDLASGNVR